MDMEVFFCPSREQLIEHINYSSAASSTVYFYWIRSGVPTVRRQRCVSVGLSGFWVLFFVFWVFFLFFFVFFVCLFFFGGWGWVSVLFVCFSFYICRFVLC